MGRHLVLVGGGHAHLTTLVRIREFIDRGHRVTLIAPAEHHYYSGMGPGMLGGFYRPDEIRFPVKAMAENRGAAFVEGRVARVDAGLRTLYLDSGQFVRYDVASFNTGSRVPEEIVSRKESNLFPVKPVENLFQGRRFVLDLLTRGVPDLLVVGGGPAGLEITGNIWKLVQDSGGAARITLLAGKRLLHSLPERSQRLAKRSLISRRVNVIEGRKVRRVEEGKAVLEDGGTFAFDACFLAIGVRPPPIFRESHLPVGKEGGLLVNRFLQSPFHPEIFGGGDNISFEPRPLDKVGVFAVKENPVLFHNLMAALENGKLTPFEPQKKYLLIFNLGDGKGLLCRGGWVWHGRLPFLLKDCIDRRFVKRFNA